MEMIYEQHLRKERLEKKLHALIKDYISDHYSKPMSMKTLAEAVGTSVYRLQNVFLRIEGISVHAYLKNYRMKQAEVLLCETSQPVGEISRRVGYESHSKFSRAFCQYSGLSPLRYRKLNQIKQAKQERRLFDASRDFS